MRCKSIIWSCEWSTISQNFPGWFFFSKTPNLLMCNGYWILSGAKHVPLPEFTINKLLNNMAGWAFTEGMLALAHSLALDQSYPILNPSLSLVMY